MIELQAIGKSFATGGPPLRVLSEVSIDIAAGEFVAVTGPSGSGKSTLMNVIGCLDSPDAGAYRFDGHTVWQDRGDGQGTGLASDGLAALRRRAFGFVFQSFHLVARMNALRNVELPLIYAGVAPAERRERAEALLERFGLAARRSHRPAELSGGQQQRVAIARAIANAPAVLIADEPTGSLDTRTGDDVMDALETLNGDGMTIVLVTHDREVAARAARRIELRDGRLVA